MKKYKVEYIDGGTLEVEAAEAQISGNFVVFLDDNRELVRMINQDQIVEIYPVQKD